MSNQVQSINKVVHLSNDLHVEVLNSEEGFDALKDDWDELLNDSNQCVYFLRWSWNRLWWRAYAPLHGRLYLIVCHDKSGRLVGLAPLYWRQTSTPLISRLSELLFIGTGIPITTSEHLDLITRRGYERQVSDAVAATVLQDRDIDRVWLTDIPITSIALPHLRRAMGPRQLLRVCNRSHYVDTRVDWDTFRQGLGRSMRAQLGGKIRRIFNLDSCEFRCVETKEELEPAMDALVRLHQARWRSKGEPGSFALMSFEEFLKAAMRSTLAEGRLQLWTLTLDGKVAAVLLGFLDNGIVHYFQGGFDPSYSKYSVGSVMLGLCIGSCLEEQSVRQFNFMGGDASYKARWTSLGLDSVEFEWLRSGARSSLFRIYESGEIAGKSLLRTVVPKTIRAAWRKRIKGK